MDRDELHKRIKLLKEEMEAGHIQIPPELQHEMNASLLKIRYVEDGMVDPATVDSRVRAMALAVLVIHEDEELKEKRSLKEIQGAYFEFLESFFGKSFREMKQKGLAPPDIAQQMASNTNLVRVLYSRGEEFFSGIQTFWETYEPVLHARLEELRCLKSVYGGDIAPSYAANIACSVGLYVDTIILPDPILKAKLFFQGKMKPQSFVYYLTKHALNILNYKDLALADVSTPLVVIVPDPSSLNQERIHYLDAISQDDVLSQCSKLFGRSFADEKELDSFLAQFLTPRDLVSRLADPTRLLFDTDWSAPLDQQILRYINELKGNYPQKSKSLTGGRIIPLMMRSRMVLINELLLKSTQYQGAPLIDAPTSWQYLLWKYEYDRDHAQELDPTLKDVIVTQALQAQGSQELHLISGLQPQDLIELRRQGALVELRETLFKGIEEIDSTSPSALAEVIHMVSANVNEAFSKHQRDLQMLSSSRKKFFGLKVPLFIGVAGITLAASSTGNIPLTLLTNGISLAVGTSSAKDLWKHGKAVIGEGAALKRSPTGILFRHRK